MILHRMCHFLRAELLVFNLRALLVSRCKNLNSGSNHAAGQTLGDNSGQLKWSSWVSDLAISGHCRWYYSIMGVHQGVCSKLCRSKQATAAWIAEFRWHCTLLVVMLIVIEAVACHSMFTRRGKHQLTRCCKWCFCTGCVIFCVLNS